MLQDALKKHRIARGWTQVQLAQKAGVSQQLIAKIESGNVLETRKLPRIASALGLSAEEFLALQPRPPPSLPLRREQDADGVLRQVLAVWPELDRQGKRHVLEAARGQLQRTGTAENPLPRSGIRRRKA
jgi:transcriptional regulator with XRE-family HTH domain